jgi:hypothetical protein
MDMDMDSKRWEPPPNSFFPSYRRQCSAESVSAGRTRSRHSPDSSLLQKTHKGDPPHGRPISSTCARPESFTLQMRNTVAKVKLAKAARAASQVSNTIRTAAFQGQERHVESRLCIPSAVSVCQAETLSHVKLCRQTGAIQGEPYLHLVLISARISFCLTDTIGTAHY